MPAPSVLPIPVPAARVRGCTRFSAVELGGADPTGAVDATAAIQRAIDQLPAKGGTVQVPAGTYLVDAAKGINLRSNMLLELDPAAVLQAIPNDQPYYGILNIVGVSNVEVSGGTVAGDRAAHIYAPQPAAAQNTHEWGMGVRIKGSSQVTIRDTVLRDCTGDGCTIASTGTIGQPGYLPCADVALLNVTRANNRRQGLTIGKCDGVVVQGGSISGTNGTAPQDGIDIEPDAGGVCQNIFIDGELIEGCAGNGIESNQRKDVDTLIRNVQITNCTVRNHAGAGMYLQSVNGLVLAGNTVSGNHLTGTFMASTVSNASVDGNTYSGNYNRGKPQAIKPRTAFVQVGTSKAVEADILNRSADPGVVVGSNTFA